MAARASTQSRMPIQSIHDDVVITKDGNASVILQTSAVNFGLLSENEQLAIISAFAGLLNSLSYVIQIVIRSKRLDISHYIDKLEEARKKQTNPLLSQMMERYREFIKNTVRENQVLDKQFYIVVSVSYLEVGISHNIEDNFEKALTLLLPRRDHIMRQLARTGLQAIQLDTEELIRLFYDIYNESGVPEPMEAPAIPDKPADSPKLEIKSISELPKAEETQVGPFPHLSFNEPTDSQPEISPTESHHRSSVFVGDGGEHQITSEELEQKAQPEMDAPTETSQPEENRYRRSTPFFVEELPDDYGTV